MVITYYGEECFRLESGKTSLLTNPASNRLKAHVVVHTHMPLRDTPFFPPEEIALPGEYEVGGIVVKGCQVPTGPKEKAMHTAYAIEWEDIRVVFLGKAPGAPDADGWSRLGEPDVLILPLDDSSGFSEKDATKLVRQLEPAVVIPYPSSGIGEFVKRMGQKVTPEERFTFKKKDLEPGATRVVALAAG